MVLLESRVVGGSRVRMILKAERTVKCRRVCPPLAVKVFAKVVMPKRRLALRTHDMIVCDGVTGYNQAREPCVAGSIELQAAKNKSCTARVVPVLVSRGLTGTSGITLTQPRQTSSATAIRAAYIMTYSF